jgi:hypothetical protein
MLAQRNGVERWPPSLLYAMVRVADPTLDVPAFT